MNQIVEMQHVAVTCEDGSLTVLSIITKDGRGIDLAAGISSEYVEELIAKSGMPDPTTGYVGWRPSLPKQVDGEFVWRFIDLTDLPGGEEWHASPYRDALRDHGKAIGHDMEKARELHRGRLRGQRTPLLADLDLRISRAMAARNVNLTEVAKLESRRQQLRDVTAHPQVAKAKTIAQLEALSNIQTLVDA